MLKRIQMAVLVLGIGCLGLLAGCGGGAATPTAAGTSAPPTAASTGPTPEGQIRLVLAGEGNEARYRVREQLARLDFPSDAIGKTQDVTGAIVMAPDGSIVSEQSSFVVNLNSLRSDESRRDNFIRNNTLQTGKYPNATFVPKTVTGLGAPLPTSGPVSFQMAGDLTVHGTTKAVVWDVTGEVSGQSLTGTATTAVTFGDFGLQAPRVPVVLSVVDHIGLEIDFHLVVDGSTP